MKHVKSSSIRPSIFSSSQNQRPSVPPNQSFPPASDYISSPTAISLSVALQHCINSDFPSHGQKIHSHILKIGFKPNTNVSIKLLILHLKSRCLRYARQLFDEMPQPTLSAYNYMISGYLKHGKIEELLNLVSRLTFSYEKPDGFTFSMILKATGCAVVGFFHCHIVLGKVVHAQILRSNVESDDVLYTALVDSYVKNGKVGYARRVFDMMLDKNVLCSTSMISGYMSQGSVEDAEDIFKRTVEKDVVVFNAMIEGYSKSVETARRSLEVYIDMQRKFQSQLVKMNFYNDIKMGSALIDMYSKCGRIEDARRVFDHMPEKNVFSWTSMIDGYGKNGNSNEALELFSRMQIECYVKPNYVTFLSALSACGHAGLVAKGWTIFESMERDYLLKPRMEHYACMVDLLGRAGSLQQAWEFVMGMPEKPGSDVWAALLSSCQLHGDVEMASIAAHEIFKLNSDGRPGAYVALSNALAAAGKWDSVSEVRQLMKVRGVSKDTGCSWVGTDSGP
ncbi:Pentatricopeptide repeat-containing protein, mitochondrial [Vitis vinifera]|uniref:Pentatricopeptide repeat-containing protein, mitochondrial n=1 Tax=Vitis vinifera TaxID=29760 RepID=A0A438H3Q2_VITVI|nr:Pentatricopeptide repeat-containing protein, mitochondrial [Vitis vinifera]